MKKLIYSLFFACLLIAAAPALTVLADEPEPSNVTITVVIPTPAEEPEQAEGPDATDLLKLYPSDVAELRDGGMWQIIKTYELADFERPEDIPCAPFERSGWTFALTDITRKETACAETREHTETATLSAETNELEQILAMLTPAIEYCSEDGYSGMLQLDVSSIKVETAGTKTSSYTMTATREYPCLSSNDTGLVPKTVEDRGKTYALASVDWQAGNTATVDYGSIPEHYTAIATYTATGYSTKTAGYTVTAEYSGSLAKLTQGKTIYTAHFIGTEIRTLLEIDVLEPAPETESVQMPTQSETAQDERLADKETGTEQAEAEFGNDSKSQFSPAWYALIPCMAIIAVGLCYFIKRR